MVPKNSFGKIKAQWKKIVNTFFYTTELFKFRISSFYKATQFAIIMFLEVAQTTFIFHN
jgi:hypothetical protein